MVEPSHTAAYAVTKSSAVEKCTLNDFSRQSEARLLSKLLSWIFGGLPISALPPLAGFDCFDLLVQTPQADPGTDLFSRLLAGGDFISSTKFYLRAAAGELQAKAAVMQSSEEREG